MKVITKFDIGQTVHFMKDGKPSTDKVKKISTVTDEKHTEESYVFELNQSLDAKICFESERELGISIGLIKPIIRKPKTSKDNE